MESAFALPPPAIHQKPASRPSPPVSPLEKPLGSNLARKRTLSGSHRVKEDTNTMQYDLPPPPSRARKIIQMKPKTGSTSSSSPPEEPPSSAQPAKSAPAAGSKRKQPSATSAAGRKIARKTAHSIIERRRRSKMNEEFGVLKDMIPACEGVEMHKLAILQAGIEYVRYLEDCIKQMKAEKENDRTQAADDESVEDEEEVDEVNEIPSPKRTAPPTTQTDWYRKSSAATDSSSNPSPNILPQGSSRFQVQPPQRPILPNISSFTNSPNHPRPNSATPTPTLLSPAFNAIHFSPDLSRTATNSNSSQLTASTGSGHLSQQSQPSPNILPLPQAMMSLDRERKSNDSPMSEGRAEATATAALMMLTTDRRESGGGQLTGHTQGQGSGQVQVERARAKGMSVRDLLSS